MELIDKIVKTFICFCLMVMAVSGKAQVIDRRPQTDTLTIADRLSVRTNIVDWTLLMPNIGVEFDLGNKNWSRWAVGLEFRGNWQTSHTFNPGVVYNLAEARTDVRYYWRPRQIDGRGVVKHKGVIDRLFSCRRNIVKRPSVVYYRGAFVSYSDYSFKFGSEGNQGTALTFGFSWGAVRPLYVFHSGNCLDIELGVNIGLCYNRNDKYRHDRESDCYPLVEEGSWRMIPFPVINNIRLGFVYRIGKYPSTSKYRWRYDCDSHYASIHDSINNAREVARINKHHSDSISKVIDAEFWKVYNAAAAANKSLADSLNRVADMKNKEDSRMKKQREVQEKATDKKVRKKKKIIEDGANGKDGGQEEAAGDSILPVEGENDKHEQPGGKASSPANNEEKEADDEVK